MSRCAEHGESYWVSCPRCDLVRMKAMWKLLNVLLEPWTRP